MTLQPPAARRLSLLLSLALACSGFGSVAIDAQAASDLVGPWTGRIEIAGLTLQIRVVVTESADGLAATIDIPQQGAKALPLHGIRHDGPSVHFELPAGPGVAVFDGVLTDGRINGAFIQGPAKGTFTLQRGDTPPPKPAEPAASLPYATEEVTFGHGDVSLAGTLSVPAGQGPFPAVALLSGSGAQTRDEEVAGFKVFRVLADHLTRHGIAVLRFDDRGVGDSTGGHAGATTEDFAIDALAAVRFLIARPEVRRSHVGLLGHSEGALVASLAATRSRDVAFVVLLAGPAVPGEQIIRAQAEAIARASGASDADVAGLRAQQDLLFKAVRTGDGWEEAVESARALGRAQLSALPAEQRAALGDAEQYLDQTIARQMAGVKTPWFKFFTAYDPAPELAKLECAVLALFGERDLQVPIAQNRPVMEHIFAGSRNARASVRAYRDANHLFQKAVSGSPTEYSVLEKAFVPGLLDDIAAWITAVR